MALFIPRGGMRPSHSPRVLVLQQDADCPQPACRHPSHGDVPVPTKYCGTSQLQGLTVHHIRCRLVPSHHRQFIQVNGRWQEIRT